MADGQPVRVRLVGDDDAADAAAAVATLVSDPADADAVVAVGTRALLDLADDPPDRPILPVDAGSGPLVVPRNRLTAALRSLAAGDVGRIDHPVLSVSVDGTPAGRALVDASVLTADPASISEYGLDGPDFPAERIRADGVVVATPLGSAGYARAAGGPIVARSGVAVVPVAQFATSRDTWVGTPPVVLSVERDEAAVELVLDGAVARPISPGERVVVDADDKLTLLRPARST